MRVTKDQNGSLFSTQPSQEWFAAYTCARHEKAVAAYLNDRQIECFLPLFCSVRRWKDRRTQIELPLFPGYVFVKIQPSERVAVLKTSGVVRFVTFNGLPTPINSHEIETLRSGLLHGISPEPHPYLIVGRKVRIARGALAGMEGVVQRKKDRFRVVISINLIMRSIAAEVDASDIEWLPKRAA